MENRFGAVESARRGSEDQRASLGPLARDVAWVRMATGYLAAPLTAALLMAASTHGWATPQVTSPTEQPAAGQAVGGGGAVVSPMDDASRRALARAWDRVCARSREAEPSEVQASLAGGGSAFSRQDVEQGLADVRELCEQAALVVEVREFVDDVLRDLSYIEESIDGVRPECGPPVRMNWDAETRRMVDLLAQMVQEVETTTVGLPDEVEELQAEIRVRLAAMFNSVEYYQQFARDICESYDLMRRDLEVEERHVRILAESAGAVFRDGIEGLSDEELTGAIDAYRADTSRFTDAFYRWTTDRMYRSGWFRGSGTVARYSHIAPILVDPQVGYNTNSRYRGRGGAVEVLKHHMTVERGRVVVWNSEPVEEVFNDRRYPAGAGFLEESTGVTVAGLDVYIRQAWGPLANIKGSGRPLVDYLEGIRPYVQDVVNRECVEDFAIDRGNLTLRARFGTALERVSPPLSGTEKSSLFAAFSTGMKRFRDTNSLTGVIDDICSEDSSTLGAQLVAQVLQDAYNGAASGSNEGESVARVLATDSSAGYLQRFDKAFYVGGELMRGLQIDAILGMENPNQNAMRALERLVSNLDPMDVQLSVGDLPTVRDVAEAIDLGRIGRERRRHEEEYDAQLERLQVAENEVRLLRIKNKHEMDVVLENNRTVLDQASMGAKARVSEARLAAEATIESAGLNANATIETARIKQAQSRPNFLSSLMATLGGVVGTSFGGPIVGALGAKLGGMIASPEPSTTTTATAVNQQVTEPAAARQGGRPQR